MQDCRCRTLKKLITIEDVIQFGEKAGYPFVIKAVNTDIDGYGNANVYFNREKCGMKPGKSLIR